MVGQTISHYRVLEKLGEGGMGVVYRAEDTTLGRTVALKFLASRLLNDDEAKQRFLREAKAAAAIRHPNICTVFEVAEENGKTFLVMDCLEGELLEERIAHGPLPLKDAFDIGRQIAEGLEAAHEKGIVHRDIKPANVMVDAKGRATIMDFGLVRLTEASSLTKADRVVGTAAYMSPEQVQGGEVDHRTDIWALGCVLYEMVAGARPFQGQYDQALAYEIVNQEPEPLTAVRAAVPLELELIIGKCLAKGSEDRYGHADETAKDLRVLIEKLKSGRSTILQLAALTGPVSARRESDLVAKRTVRAFQGLFALSVVAVIALASTYFRQPPTPEIPLRRFVIATPEEIRQSHYQRATAISPDGRHIAFVASGGDGKLWVHDLDQPSPRAIEGTEGATSPFWAPDSDFIGFAAGEDLRKVAVGGRFPVRICTIPGYFYGGTWSPDGEVIAYGAGSPVPSIYQVDARGGPPSLLFGATRNLGFARPHFLPAGAGSRVLLYMRAVGPEDKGTTVVEDLEGKRRVELATGWFPVYSPSGHIVYQEGANTFNLWAAPFSLKTLEATGKAFLVMEDGRAATVSSDGTLAYAAGLKHERRQAVWVNRSGQVTSETGLAAEGLWNLKLSPDGRSVAFDAWEGSNRDVWVYDLERRSRTRLSSAEEPDSNPVWSPDGRLVAFYSDRSGSKDIFVRRADGAKRERALLATNDSELVSDWSQDGNYIFFYGVFSEAESLDVRYLEKHDAAWTPRPFLRSPAHELNPMLSPNGRYLAYVGAEGGPPEVYIQPFPEGGRRTTISNSGGFGIRWRHDGNELFYLQRQTLMAVDIFTEGAFSAGPPTPAFERLDPARDFRFVNDIGADIGYDVSPDGRRFLVIEALADQETSETRKARTSIHVVQNWYEEFRDRQ